MSISGIEKSLISEYVLAYSFASSVGFVFFILSSDYDQNFFKSDFDEKLVKEYLRKSFKYALIASFLILLSASVYIYFNVKYRDTLLLILTLLPSFYFLSYYQIGVNKLVFLNKKKMIPIFTAAVSIINLVINIILLSKVGIISGVLANWVANFILAFFIAIYLRVSLKYIFLNLLISILILIFYLYVTW